MPGLVRDLAHVGRLDKSSSMDVIKKIINNTGVVVPAGAWPAGGVASKTVGIRSPEAVKRR